MNVKRIVVVACACRSLVTLKRIRAPGKRTSFFFWGAVCGFCGRGIDLSMEKQPANEASR